jgi:oligopeptide transport system substrate-binding protein
MRRLGLALTLVLALVACERPPAPTPPAPADPSASPSPAPPGTLRVAVEEPRDLLPQRADTLSEQWVADALFDSLTAWDRSLRPQPSAAVSWEPSGDARTWTFRMREDGSWHDGTPVTSEDVVRGWTRVVRDGAMAHLLEGVDGYEALRAGDADELVGLETPDEHTLVVRLAQPDADFASTVGHPALAPMAAGTELVEERPVGNGPFAAAEARAPGRFLRLRRFGGWRNGATPRLDEIVFQTMEPTTAYLAFQQGRVHVAPVPPGALADARDDERATLERDVSAALYLLGVDVRQPPFDSPDVRRALALAVDRSQLARSLREGSTAPARGLIPRGFPEWSAGDCADCRRNLAQARAAFADAGVSTLTLAFNEGGGHDEVARLLRAALARAGVTLELRPLPPEEYFPSLRAGELTLFRFGWRPDVPSADAVLRPLLHSSSIPEGAEDRDALHHNHGRYRNPRVDALLDQARATLDLEARAALYRMAEREALAERPLLPLFWYRHRTAVAPEVVNFNLGPLALPDWSTVRLAEPRR